MVGFLRCSVLATCELLAPVERMGSAANGSRNELAASCCQASEAQRRQSVLPVPVGDSSSAFWPCEHKDIHMETLPRFCSLNQVSHCSLNSVRMPRLVLRRLSHHRLTSRAGFRRVAVKRGGDGI